METAKRDDADTALLDYMDLKYGDDKMAPHRPDGGMPTPPPGMARSPGDLEQEWRDGVWAALRDLKRGVDTQTTQITQLLIATSGAVKEVDLNKGLQAVREEMFKELKAAKEANEKEMEPRDRQLRELHDFKVRIMTIVLVGNAALVILGVLAGLGLHFWK
jgi:hypothetical protein